MGDPHMDSREASVPRQARGTANPPPPETDAAGTGPDNTADPSSPRSPAAAVTEADRAASDPPAPSSPSGPDSPDGTAATGDSDGGSPPSSDWRSGYRDVLRVPEYRALWSAHALAITGNFLLNIALTVLVYQQTSSALAAGITLALTFIPQVVGGPLLSGLADIFPRRSVLIVCDVVRAVLVAAMGIPGLPTWAIWGLLFLSTLPLVPFGAARAALMSEIVQGERYIAGSAILQLTSQAGTLVGLAAGGWIVSVIGANSAVMYNGLTFLASAAIIHFGVRHRPAPRDEGGSRQSLWQATRDGTRVVLGDSRLRTLGMFAWLAGIYMMPYGLANPLADEAGGGSTAAGFIMAGPSLGAVAGGLVLTRLISPTTRMHMMGPLAVAASAPLLLWMADPPLWAIVALLITSGAAASYQFVANAAFVLCVPGEGRGLAFGLVAAGLQAAQGIGIALASLLVEVTSTQAVIVGAGAVGVLSALCLALHWSRISHSAIDLMNTPEPAAS
ncbi:MFS transporter [Streptomonospora salina]|uniref:Putative MFS family arabinose efflux permease n=1 Tax=Streptomonospora salina TaxID=104205 RepID=A0A841EB89_9ACTN|nr:MFS transporter [Streptomonospora salina]MBB5998333.1 putative MFS family arabinose efflux permease [Streptomonospora salina]